MSVICNIPGYYQLLQGLMWQPPRIWQVINIEKGHKKSAAKATLVKKE